MVLVIAVLIHDLSIQMSTHLSITLYVTPAILSGTGEILSITRFQVSFRLILSGLDLCLDQCDEKNIALS